MIDSNFIETQERQDESLERKVAQVYRRYFGPDWKEKLFEALLIKVRVGTDKDRQQLGLSIGHASTSAVVDPKTRLLVENRIVVFSPSDFSLRAEIGEALYDLLETTAVSGKLCFYRYSSEEIRPLKGIEVLLIQKDSPQAVIETCREILDRWNSVYTTKPDRYHGMHPDRIRDYGKIREWQSEGFADAVAVEIKRRSGRELTLHEASIWDSLPPEGQKIISFCVETFLPPIISIH